MLIFMKIVIILIITIITITIIIIIMVMLVQVVDVLPSFVLPCLALWPAIIGRAILRNANCEGSRT